MTVAAAPEFDSTFVVLEPDLSAVAVPVTPTVFADLDARFDHCKGRVLISSFAFDSDWSTWEMHPHGDEIVCLLEGDVHVVFDQDGSEAVLHLAKPGAFAIVPRGTWHTARTSVPTRMLFMTPGEGTDHRPA